MLHAALLYGHHSAKMFLQGKPIQRPQHIAMLVAYTPTWSTATIRTEICDSNAFNVTFFRLRYIEGTLWTYAIRNAV